MPIKGLPGGDFGGCIKAMSGKMRSPEAFCAWKIHELTGKWPTEESISEVNIDGDFSEHVMIAYPIPEEVSEWLVLKGDFFDTVEPSAMHLTMLYLGKLTDLPSKEDIIKVFEGLDFPAVLTATLTGWGRFTAAEEDCDPIVALVDCVGLSELRAALVNIVRGLDPDIQFTHGFIPHVTMVYVGKNNAISLMDIPNLKFILENLSLVYGDEWIRLASITTPTTESASFIVDDSVDHLTIREATPGFPPNVVLLSGRALVGGLSKSGKFYTDEALGSFIERWANKPIRINHPSRSEDRDRPEGDVFVQVGKLPDESNWEIRTITDDPNFNGRKGVYFKDAILSASPADLWISHRIQAGIIGDLSINGGGKAIDEGNVKRVLEFTEGVSLDLVTTAGAGGQVES